MSRYQHELQISLLYVVLETSILGTCIVEFKAEVINNNNESRENISELN
jgi:hypothetical protein